MNISELVESLGEYQEQYNGQPSIFRHVARNLVGYVLIQPEIDWSGKVAQCSRRAIQRYVSLLDQFPHFHARQIASDEEERAQNRIHDPLSYVNDHYIHLIAEKYQARIRDQSLEETMFTHVTQTLQELMEGYIRTREQTRAAEAKDLFLTYLDMMEESPEFREEQLRPNHRQEQPDVTRYIAKKQEQFGRHAA